MHIVTTAGYKPYKKVQFKYVCTYKLTKVLVYTCFEAYLVLNNKCHNIIMSIRLLSIASCF